MNSLVVITVGALKTCDGFHRRDGVVHPPIHTIDLRSPFAVFHVVS